LHVVHGHPLAGDAFQEGRFYVQDEASMLVAELLGAQPGERIADVCAAPGGKATALAARVGPRGLLLACDLRPRRLRLVRDNARRMGLDPVRLLAQDAARPALQPACLDRVLLDAPCTGTGVLRRHPEIRWRREEEDVMRMARLQSELLSAAADLVRPAGVLVYSVCSLEPEEGPQVVQGLLERRDDYILLEPSGIAPELVDRQGERRYMRTDPQRHGLDGFFAAVLRRKDG